MSWYAVDAVDDAIGATQAFLGGASLGRWGRLAVITLLLGAGGVGGQFSNFSNAPGLPGEGAGPSGELPPVDLGGAGATELGLLAGLVAVLLTVWLVFGVVAAVMEFVFLAALSTDEVRVRAPFGRYARDGVRLFGFRLALTLPVVLPVIVAAAALLTGAVSLGTVGVGGVALLVTVVTGVATVSGFVRSLTNQLVVPVMFAERRGVVDAWRRLWPSLRGEGWQTAVYVLVHLLVGVGVGIVRTFLLLLGAIPATVLAGTVGLVAGTLGGGAAGPLDVGLGLLAGSVTWLLAMFAVLVPVNAVAKTYTRAFELRALAGFDDDLAILSPSLVPATTHPAPDETTRRDGTEYAELDDSDGDDDRDRWA